jgi:hypothetical protein
VANRPSARTLRVLSFGAGGLAFGAAVAAFAFGLAAAGDGDAPRVATGERALDADQAEVKGTVTRVVGTQVAGSVLQLPLTMNVVRGGGTKATFTGGTVGGKPQVVAWDGGRPLPVTGAGSLDLAGAADVEITSAGATWTLDGVPRVLTSGTYRFGATVAVGAEGLAAPKDGVTLAVPSTASLVTHGGVTVATARAAIDLGGPGGLLLEGELAVRTSKGTNAAGSIRFGPGSFTLSLAPQPDGGGYTITGSLLQGTVTEGG